MVAGGRGRHWLGRHRQGVAYGLIAVFLVLAVAATTVGGLRLHRAVLIERQTVRTQKLNATVLELQMHPGKRQRAAANAAFASVAAHDAAEGRRLHAAYVAFLRAPQSGERLSALESRLQSEIANESDRMRVANPAARAALVLAAVAFGLLVALLVWQFELARRAGRIDRDHAKRAEELLRLRDEFVAVISHELRTPMTSIIGYLELIGEGDAGPLTAEQRAYLGVVQRSTDRLVELVDELLLVAEAGRGQLMLDRVAVDSGRLVADAVAAGRPAADTRSIVLRAEAGDAGTFSGDRKRLAQMLDNLVSNAIKFTPDGGRVTVRSAQVYGSVVFEVTDSGAGISAEDKEHLFDAFFRSRAAIDGAVPGTGLGLTITKAIVDAHGGVIEVRSPAGGGTSFRVTIPAGTT